MAHSKPADSQDRRQKVRCTPIMQKQIQDLLTELGIAVTTIEQICVTIGDRQFDHFTKDLKGSLQTPLVLRDIAIRTQISSNHGRIRLNDRYVRHRIPSS